MTEEQVKVFKKIFQDFSGTLPNKVEKNTSEMKYHLLADGVYWTDEGIEEAHWELSNIFRFVLNYRTTLLTGEGSSKCRSVYFLARKFFPDWVGFQKERTTYNEEYAERIRRLRKVSQYKIEKLFKED